MGGTVDGGIKARDMNYQKHGKDFYKKIGSYGGKKGRGHQFAHGALDPAETGRRGGRPKGFTQTLEARRKIKIGQLGYKLRVGKFSLAEHERAVYEVEQWYREQADKRDRNRVKANLNRLLGHRDYA